MNKILTISAVFALALGIFGCGRKSGSTATEAVQIRKTTDNQDSNTTYVIRKDFDDALRHAPVLDIKSPAFDEDGANFWYEQIGKQILVEMTMTSKRFNAAVDSIMSPLTNATPVDVDAAVRHALEEIRAMRADTASEVFMKKFLAHYMADTMTVMRGTEDFAGLLLKLGIPENIPMGQALADVRGAWQSYRTKDLARYAEEFRTDAQNVRLTIFAPSLNGNDQLVRYRLWLTLHEVADSAEAALKARQ